MVNLTDTGKADLTLAFNTMKTGPSHLCVESSEVVTRQPDIANGKTKYLREFCKLSPYRYGLVHI